MAVVASISSLASFYSLNASVRITKSDSYSPLSAFAKPDVSTDPIDVIEVVKTLNQARKTLIAYREKDALDRLERARKELELLRQLGGDEKWIASKAKQIAQQIGKAAIEYGDAAQSLRRSGDATAPEQADASTSLATQTSDATQTSTGGDAAPAIGTAAVDNPASKNPFSTSAADTGAPSDKIPTLSVKTDADALKEFADAENEVKRVFDELVRKGKIKHTSSREWLEAERAKAEAGQDIQNLSDQIGAGQAISVAASASITEVQTTVSISIDILA